MGDTTLSKGHAENKPCADESNFAFFGRHQTGCPLPITVAARVAREGISDCEDAT